MEIDERTPLVGEWVSYEEGLDGPAKVTEIDSATRMFKAIYLEECDPNGRQLRVATVECPLSDIRFIFTNPDTIEKLEKELQNA